MADAVIGATIEVVLKTVLSLAKDQIDLVLGFKEELERLLKTAEIIQGFVADADDKKHSPGVLHWLKDLEGEVFKAENVLDEVNYENLRREVKYRSQLKRKVCFFSFFSTIGFRSRMASKIREINTKLERINQDASQFELVTRYQIEAALSAVLAPAVATTSRQTDSVVVPNVVGRANDESKIVEMLLSPSDKVVSVIPIFGPPGLGKTTLAKSVYNHSEISGHFRKKIWVCVAAKIDEVELFKFILESLTRGKVEVNRRETIVQKIREELGGERYLLVLDDVWNEEQLLWNGFFDTLEGLNATKGSWCLATTRLEPVANTMSRHLKMNIGPYKLGSLTDDDCWSIIKRKVIGREEVPQELEAIKEQILRRCGGLPLAATLIGGLLLKKGKEEWRFIVEKSLLNGDQVDVNGDQVNVKQIIKVSFDHLSPASVKKCLVYCSMFSQDTAMEKDLLVELWMAEGFLQPERLMEDIGDKYFRILLQSSLLEEVELGGTRYKMHDLVHDVAKSALNEARYLAWTSSQGTAEDIIKKNSTSLRTLFLESSISTDILSKFECLHVLKLFGKDVKVLPDSIGKLIRLRFLDISDSQITKLPKSLCKLYNLQSLRIKNYTLEEVLPKQMSNLISLRHLHYYDTRADFQMPSEMGRLTRLQTLKFFNIGEENGRGIEELGNLKDLKGSLEIRNLELVTGKEGAEKAKLFEKPNLSVLRYLWGRGDRESNNCDENILEGLQPPQNLQKLEISNFAGNQFPKWLINLSTLVKLELTDCKKCRELPALGQLPSLEDLKLDELENIRSIGLSFYGFSSGGGGQVRKSFPALKHLCLENMVNLVEWKDEDEVKATTRAAEVDLFPVLEYLNIWHCSRLTGAPSHLPSIELCIISCHLSLLKKIVSNVTSLSSVELLGNMLDVDDSHRNEHIGRLLVERLEEDVEQRKMYLFDCGSLPSEMLEHFLSFRDLELREFSNLTRFVGQVNFFTSIKQLEIADCDGLTSLPHEMLKSCVSLQKLKIFRCEELTSLPDEMLVSCASLQKFTLCWCDGITNIPDKMLESCSSLQELKISKCYGLTSLPGEMLKSCASLQKLKIFWSLGLTSLPGEMLKSCASLQKLVISHCDELTNLPGEMLESCGSLQELEISHCHGLINLPGKMLELCASLQILKVCYCSKLVSFPHDLRKTPSLEILDLSRCRELMIAEMPKGFRFLTSLRELAIGPFSSNETNEEFDWSGLIISSSSTLTSLRFHGLPHAECLPNQLQHLTSLTELLLDDFGIEALPDWIGNLASLERLELLDCEKLRDLPSVATKRRLTKFTSLRIFRCPLLEERCKSGTNSEWPIHLL